MVAADMPRPDGHPTELDVEPVVEDDEKITPLKTTATTAKPTLVFAAAVALVARGWRLKP